MSAPVVEQLRAAVLVIIIEGMTGSESSYDVNCEWGSEGLERALAKSVAVIIVDVLSFTTSVEVAVQNGAIVYPCNASADEAKKYALSLGALVASPARSFSTYSLSPASLQRITSGTKLVLPSPNGSSLSALAGSIPAFAGCLRNARAVAEKAQQFGYPLSVVPSGERWDDGTLRFAVEDLLGAGAIVSCLRGTRSPEAEAAAAVFERFSDDILMALSECVSGRELIERGFTNDVELSAQLNVSACVPVIRERAFVDSKSLIGR